MLSIVAAGDGSKLPANERRCLLDLELVREGPRDALILTREGRRELKHRRRVLADIRGMLREARDARIELDAMVVGEKRDVSEVPVERLEDGFRLIGDGSPEDDEMPVISARAMSVVIASCVRDMFRAADDAMGDPNP